VSLPRTRSVVVALVLLGTLLGLAARGLGATGATADSGATTDSGAAPDSVAAAPDSARAAVKGNAAAGKKIFVVKCVACHKPNGRGGLKLTGNPTPDWRDAKRMADPKYDDAYLRDCITNGKIKSGMISWKSQLKPADIVNLIAYIRTFSAPRATAR